MEDLAFNATYKSITGIVEIGLNLFQFKEDGIQFIYSPDLDLTGYGKTIRKARRSFEESLAEFITYTIRKKTLDKELKKHGWTLIRPRRQRPKSYSPPDLASLLRDNEYLTDIFNNKDFSRTRESFNVPANA
jgi:hypothetical protein